MKQSGKSIQSRSLNRVLGNLDSFHVQPYEVFVEEEQKKLHQHWSVYCEGNVFLKLHQTVDYLLPHNSHLFIGHNCQPKLSQWRMLTG